MWEGWVVENFDKCHNFLFSYALFDMDGHQVPQPLVIEVGETLKKILKEVCFIFEFIRRASIGNLDV